MRWASSGVVAAALGLAACTSVRTPPALRVSISGPDTAFKGDMVEFTATYSRSLPDGVITNWIWSDDEKITGSGHYTARRVFRTTGTYSVWAFVVKDFYTSELSNRWVIRIVDRPNSAVGRSLERF